MASIFCSYGQRRLGYWKKITYSARKHQSILQKPSLLENGSDIWVISATVQSQSRLLKSEQRPVNFHVRLGTVKGSGALAELIKK
jgi:hypothetical protein